MGWDKGGRYYTRSRRVNGRVVREYVGGGVLAELVAQSDALERDQREAERTCAKNERDRITALDAPLAELDELADLVARAALASAGYAQQARRMEEEAWLTRRSWHRRKKPYRRRLPNSGHC